MIKSIFSVLMIAVILLLASCKKDSETATPSTQVKTYTEDVTSSATHMAVTYNVSYDGNGRITALESTTGNNKFVYTYPTATTYSMEIIESNALSIHVDFFLNSFSLVDSSLQYNDTHDSTTEKYNYNSAKQIISLKSYNYSKLNGSILDEMHTYTYDANGNQVKDISSSGSVVTSDYSTTANTLSFGLPYNYVPPFLVQKTTTVKGGSTVVINYTYTFDSSNRITSEKDIYSTGEVVIKTYTY